MNKLHVCKRLQKMETTNGDKVRKLQNLPRAPGLGIASLGSGGGDVVARGERNIPDQWSSLKKKLQWLNKEDR